MRFFAKALSIYAVFSIFMIFLMDFLYAQTRNKPEAENSTSETYSVLSKHLKETPWQRLEDGLLMKSMPAKDQFVFHAWKFDQSLFSFHVVEQKNPKGLMVSELFSESNAILAINGGFFEKNEDQTLTASGLLMVASQKRSSYLPRGGSALFYIKAGKAFVDWSRNFSSDDHLKEIQEAVQSGPMVVDPGGRNGIKRNDQKTAHRSAVCLRDEHVMIVATTAWLTLYDWGQLLATSEQEGGLGCERAINLDGGPSTQVLFRYSSQKIHIPEQSRVHNAVTVSRREPHLTKE